MATVPLGLYLWRRVHEIGVESIQGLPGDFNMNFLDYIYKVPGLRWIGNSNELNAAYAADGYARVKGLPGCLVTTHGVGELSALNGIAGAASEHVPVIHVVGQTARAVQENHAMIHHSIGFYPDHQVYNKISKNIRCAVAELWDPEDAPAKIDYAIRECFLHRLPVYIYFPIDISDSPVSAAPLDKPLDLSPPVDKKSEDEVVELIQAELTGAKNPAVFVDYLTHTYGRKQAQTFVDKLQLPTYAAHMGKGCVNENADYFVGLYNAGFGQTGVAEALESADLIITLGWFGCDTNSAAFTRNLPEENRVDIMHDHVVIRGKKKFSSVFMGPLLERLTAEINASDIPRVTIPKAGASRVPRDQDPKGLTQNFAWVRLGEFLRPGDVLLADTGTCQYGMPDMSFPADIKYIGQTYYMSIGYTCPAAHGADLALQELHRASKTSQRGRTILVIGDGSLQLTVQEIGTMIQHKTPVIIVIVNNDGYTIERAIHGARETYNDIPKYDYSAMLKFFGAANSEQSYHCATTNAEFDKVLKHDNLVNPPELQVLELKMNKLDIPWRLAGLLRTRDPNYLKDEGFSNVPN